MVRSQAHTYVLQICVQEITELFCYLTFTSEEAGQGLCFHSHFQKGKYFDFPDEWC